MSPLVCASLYEAVVGRSGGVCQCHADEPGACGKDSHPVTGKQCREQGDAIRGPLLVAPIDPTTPDRVAVTLGADELLALCRACFVRRRNTARKAREAELAEQAAEQQGELFALPADTERTA